MIGFACQISPRQKRSRRHDPSHPLRIRHACPRVSGLLGLGPTGVGEDVLWRHRQQEPGDRAGHPTEPRLYADRQRFRLPRLADLHRPQLAGAAGPARHAQWQCKARHARHDGVGDLQDLGADLPAQRDRPRPVAERADASECRAGRPHGASRLGPDPRAIAQIARTQIDRTILQSIAQAGGGILYDQQKEPVYYEIAMNEDQYNYIQRNGLYNAQTQITFATTQTIALPGGVTQYGNQSAIELKAAWKILTQDELNYA